jgi:hypothetical protein
LVLMVSGHPAPYNEWTRQIDVTARPKLRRANF